MKDSPNQSPQPNGLGYHASCVRTSRARPPHGRLVAFGMRRMFQFLAAAFAMLLAGCVTAEYKSEGRIAVLKERASLLGFSFLRERYG
jgi:hypothetical protein